MIKIKKITFFLIKSALALVLLLIIILFFYTVFFYEPLNTETKEAEIEISKKEEKPEKNIERKKNELKSQTEKKIKKITKDEKKFKTEKIKTTLKDGLFATVGNKAITRSDIVNEVKRILILNNMTYTADKRDMLQKMAVQSVIKRAVKEIAISQNDFLKFKQGDLNRELNILAEKINVDLNTLKKICESNNLNFSVIENPVKTELLWNSLIFIIYKDRVSINLDEIDEQLKSNQNKNEFTKFLLSEIVIKISDENKIESQIEEIKNKIKSDGFEKIAMNLSISQTAENGGDLGWLHENQIAKKFKSIISNTPIGNLSAPIIMSEGILFFKVRDIKKIKQEINLEKLKNQLVNTEKTKILNMYSKSHYDSLKRSTVVNFFNE